MGEHTRRATIIMLLVVIGSLTFTHPVSAGPGAVPLDFQPFAGMGVGGLISWLVLTWKRGDDKSREEERKAQAEQILEMTKNHASDVTARDRLYADALIRHAEQLAGVNENVLAVVVANTKVQAELVTAINFMARQRRRGDPPATDIN